MARLPVLLNSIKEDPALFPTSGGNRPVLGRMSPVTADRYPSVIDRCAVQLASAESTFVKRI